MVKSIHLLLLGYPRQPLPENGNKHPVICE